MKLGARTFRVQWDVHAWPGVAASLFLFVTFFCGVFALYREEFEVWQDPALHAPPAPGGDAVSFDALLARLEASGAVAPGARVSFASRPGTRFVAASVEGPGDGPARVVALDPAGAAEVPERSRLAEELYLMHFFYRAPFGLELAGVLAVALLVALASGLAIHLKDLRRQLWQFRPARRLRFAASDVHKVLGVFGLPFVATLAWSGAVLCLSDLVGQGLARAAFGGSADRVAELSGYARPKPPPGGPAPSPPLTIARLVERARAAVPGAAGAPTYVELHHVGDRNAWARIMFPGEPLRDRRREASLAAATGEVLATSLARRAPYARFEGTLTDLHFAGYGGQLVKALYALLALAACAVLVTGNLVWLERRDPGRARAGNRLLERLTVGAAAGLVFASAAYFAANRALPWGLGGRADWEFRAFLAAWALAALAAFAPRWRPRPLAASLAGGAAALFALVVAADLAAREANLVTALARGLPAVFVADLVLVALAAGSAAAAWGLARRAPRAAASAARPRPPASADRAPVEPLA